MRLLITGGNSRLVRALCSALPEEHSLRLIGEDFDDALPSRVERCVGDPCDIAFLEEAVKGVDIVLHLTALEVLEDPGTSDADSLSALDRVTRGTYNLLNAALEAGVQRFVIGSSLCLFDRLPTSWKVSEWWQPRPTPAIKDLVPWMAELSAREMARTMTSRFVCLRFGQIVDAADIAAAEPDSRWLHLEDAVQGVECALAFLQEEPPRPEWRIFHITAAGESAKVRLNAAGGKRFGYQPKHTFQSARSAADENPGGSDWRAVLSREPILSRPIQRVVIFGAGGPVAATLAQEIAPHTALRLADLRPLADIAAEGIHQFPGAPIAAPFPEPHENRIVDVRDAKQVNAACEGMDAVVNLTVLRHDPVDAFHVNTLGAYHIVRAAVQHRIRRIVQTGPQQITMDDRVGYGWDYDIPGEVPARPGSSLYGHSKYLGQEICRVFADYYDLEIPNLLYTQFLNPDVQKDLHPYAVTWQDSARALRAALEVPSLPAPYSEVNICADIPHGWVSAQRAREVLHWTAQDDLSHLWQKPKEVIP